MTIERVTPQSVGLVLPRLLEMVREVCRLHESWDPAKFSYLPDVVDRYARWLPQRAADPRSVLAIAREGDAIVGFLVASTEREIPVYRLSEFLFVHDMFVEPACRGRGLGRLLMQHALERAREIGVTQLRLDVARANEPARRLFESCGFRVSVSEMLREI
ncbi:MAG: GNAT family N-acetyltransferase [Tepidisphaera sp.]|nr:GNAT family N-acetyltransferase [Tepidisphaera sp.]